MVGREHRSLCRAKSSRIGKKETLLLETGCMCIKEETLFHNRVPAITRLQTGPGHSDRPTPLNATTSTLACIGR
ncbi:hypothetical protein LSAT2_012942 [Lamellibrachia satsuma]|nr:hypothetical protein LSAT2_012942 [Lamellibrachia satsuma]